MFNLIKYLIFYPRKDHVDFMAARVTTFQSTSPFNQPKLPHTWHWQLRLICLTICWIQLMYIIYLHIHVTPNIGYKSLSLLLHDSRAAAEPGEPWVTSRSWRLDGETSAKMSEQQSINNPVFETTKQILRKRMWFSEDIFSCWILQKRLGRWARWWNTQI